MTPAELAAAIGMSHRVLRGWLRRQYPRPDDEHYARWDNADQIAAARAHFGGRYTPGPAGSAPARRIVQAVSQGPADWYYEGNVVAVLVRWLGAQGYAIEFVANTAIKEQGDDDSAASRSRGSCSTPGLYPRALRGSRRSTCSESRSRRSSSSPDSSRCSRRPSSRALDSASPSTGTRPMS